MLFCSNPIANPGAVGVRDLPTSCVTLLVGLVTPAGVTPWSRCGLDGVGVLSLYGTEESEPTIFQHRSALRSWNLHSHLHACLSFSYLFSSYAIDCFQTCLPNSNSGELFWIDFHWVMAWWCDCHSSWRTKVGEIKHNVHCKLKYLRLSLNCCCLNNWECSLVKLCPASDGAATTPPKCNQVANQFEYFQWTVNTWSASMSYLWIVWCNVYLQNFTKCSKRDERWNAVNKLFMTITHLALFITEMRQSYWLDMETKFHFREMILKYWCVSVIMLWL